MFVLPIMGSAVRTDGYLQLPWLPVQYARTIAIPSMAYKSARPLTRVYGL